MLLCSRVLCSIAVLCNGAVHAPLSCDNVVNYFCSVYMYMNIKNNYDLPLIFYFYR